MLDPLATLILVGIVFFAALEQTISGFGFSLIVMPLATLLLGLKTAAPLVALAGLTLYTINLLRYRASLNPREIWHLGIAAACGVPVGIWGLVNLNEILIKFFLGLILVAYSLYHFVRPLHPQRISSRWVYLAGFITGCLGGAYNTPGPPLIVYGTLRQWQRDEFRATLQAMFFLTGSLAVLSHWFTAHLTPLILIFYLFAAPALGVGILVGAWVDRRIEHETFRRLVLALILVLGFSLMLGGR